MTSGSKETNEVSPLSSYLTATKKVSRLDHKERKTGEFGEPPCTGTEKPEKLGGQNPRQRTEKARAAQREFQAL